MSSELTECVSACVHVCVCMCVCIPSSATDCASAGAEPQGKHERLDITGDIWHVGICVHTVCLHILRPCVCVCEQYQLLPIVDYLYVCMHVLM